MPNAFVDSVCPIEAVCKIGRLTAPPCIIEQPPTLHITPDARDPRLPPRIAISVLNLSRYKGEAPWMRVDEPNRLIKHIGPAPGICGFTFSRVEWNGSAVTGVTQKTLWVDARGHVTNTDCTSSSSYSQSSSSTGIYVPPGGSTPGACEDMPECPSSMTITVTSENTLDTDYDINGTWTVLWNVSNANWEYNIGALNGNCCGPWIVLECTGATYTVTIEDRVSGYYYEAYFQRTNNTDCPTPGEYEFTGQSNNVDFGEVIYADAIVTVN